MKKSWMRLLAVLCAMMMLVCEIPLIAQAGEVPAEEQQQTEGEAAAAAEPVQDVSAAPAEEVPAAPAEEVPAAPAEDVPAAPAEEASAAPAEEVPAAPAQDVPAAPAEDVPAAPAADTPAEPAAPAADVPAAPSADTPAAPAAPAADAPAAPAADTPAAPAADTPAAPAADTPATPAKPAEQVKADRTMKVYDTAVFTLEAGKSYLIRLDEGKKGRFLIDAQAEFELELQVRDETAKQNIEPEPEKTGEDGEPIPFPCTFVAVKGHTYLLTFKAKDETATGSVTVLVTRPAKYYGTEDNTDDDNEKEEEPKTGDVQADEQKDNTGNTDAGSDDETAAADLTRQDADPDAGNGTADAAAQDTPADGGQQEVPQNQQEDLTDAEPSGEQKQEPAGDSDTDPAKQNEQESDGNKEQEPADDAAQNDGAAAAAKTEIQIEDHKIGEKPKEPVEDQTEGQAEKELSGLSGADPVVKDVKLMIENYLQTETGEELIPKTAVTNTFKVYQKAATKQEDWDSPIDVGMPGSSKKPDYTGYTTNHSVNVTIEGSSKKTEYDTAVTEGLVYIEQDKASMPKLITDADGHPWAYSKTVIQTEYAWRPDDKNDGKLHTSNELKSIPEVLGNYDTWTDDDGTEKALFNEYQNVYVYNVYKPVAPEIAELEPYQGTSELGRVLAGDEITYEIKFQNYKEDTSVIAVVTDILDKYTEFVSASNGGVHKNGQVTWRIGLKPGEKASVTVTVKVKEGAQTSRKGPGRVSNYCNVTIGRDPTTRTETIENPVAEKPEKSESKPYTGKGVLRAVRPGDEITYEIKFRNYLEENAKVVIIDQLDKNVQFVSATPSSKDITSYDEKTHTVTWTINEVKPNTLGKVTVKVKVLDSALVSKKGPGKVVNGGNTATVVIGDEDPFTLDVVENPVPDWLRKKETKPYSGFGALGPVQVGTNITYEIPYKNYKDTAADIVITDKLDKNVSYVSATPKDETIVKYDKETHTVTWTLKAVEAGKEDKVTLTVKVLETALKPKTKGETAPRKVVNSGSSNETTLKVGDDEAYTMSSVTNPVLESPVKRETIPYKGTEKLKEVKVGQKMTYEISYKNYNAKKDATIVITDKLDENVKFRSATCNPRTGKATYDAKTHTVTWVFENVAPGKKVTGTLKTKVLEKGRGKKVENQAQVQVGNDMKFNTNKISQKISKTGEAPDTGDHSNSGLWLALLIFSLLGAGWFGFRLIQAKKAK